LRERIKEVSLKAFNSLWLAFVLCGGWFEGVYCNQSHILIKDAWVRPSRVENSAAYMVIENASRTLDQLVSVQTEICDRVELHRIEKVKGIFRMRPVTAIDIPAQSTTILKPSGMHIMLLGLHRPLKVDEKVILILNFSKAGPIKIEAKVRSLHYKRAPSAPSVISRGEHSHSYLKASKDENQWLFLYKG
jgi:copper(I)-binding protein